MAEASVLGAITGKFVGAVLNEVIAKTKNAYRCKESCDNLLSTLESVKPLLDHVSRSADAGNTTCQDWLKTMHALLKKAKAVLGDCVVKKSRFHWKYVRKSLASKKIKTINGQIREKVPESNLLTLGIVQAIYQLMTAQGTTPPLVLQSVPPNIAAFEEDPFKQVKDLIVAAGNGVGDPMTIGLKGKGGAGKTLIAKMVNNDKDVQDKYSMILWITIGLDASTADVYNTMGKSLNDGGVFEKDYAHKNLEDQRNHLMEAFKSKKMLLILDDVWENSCNKRAIYWLDICKGRGSATLITTRDSSVLQCAKVEKKIDILSLSKEESWKLFSYHAFKTSNHMVGEVENMARKICEDCNGLPLALKVIGSALWGNNNVRDWRIALNPLTASSSIHRTVEHELFYCLKFSYNELEEDKKKCFLYFAAFPKDYEISTKQLCSIWHSERIFGTLDNEDMSHALAMKALTILADRSLIDLSEDRLTAKIHDIFRNLAIHIISEAEVGEWASECYFAPRKVLKAFPRMKETMKRLSLVKSSIEGWDFHNKVQLPHLQVLLLSEFTIENLGAFLDGLIRSTMKLAYLDLKGCKSLKKLPKGIKELKFLVHLDLSNCEFLEELPYGFKELKSLVHLNLSNCRSLKELPCDINEFKSLVYLDLSYCMSLKEFPYCFKGLKSLIYLDLSWLDSLKELPEGIKELKSLVHLNLSYCMSLKKLPNDIKEFKSLMYLNLLNCNKLKKLPEGIKELKSLVHLNLSYCMSLKKLPEGIKELESLVHLDLSSCTSLKKLPEGIAELKSLMHLNLSHCSFLKELPKDIKQLKSLKLILY